MADASASGVLSAVGVCEPWAPSLFSKPVLHVRMLLHRGMKRRSMMGLFFKLSCLKILFKRNLLVRFVVSQNCF